MNTQDIINYYASLLILQYVGLPKASATIKAYANPLIQPVVTTNLISFSAIPDSGTFTLFWGLEETAPIDFDATAEDVRVALSAIPGLEDITVTGDFESGFTVTFFGVQPVAALLVTGGNTLENGANPITITIAETDQTLPLTVQDAFNLIGDEDKLAVGKQLDTIGKYVGVKRTAQGLTSLITLDDADFRTLIKLSIVKNSSGSSLAEIQNILHIFFPGQLLVFDYANMTMNYMLSSGLGSQNLVELFITQGLLPRPMAVQVSVVIYAPTINRFFGFRTYELPASNNTPFNTYEDYDMNSPWLLYQYALIIGM